MAAGSKRRGQMLQECFAMLTLDSRYDLPHLHPFQGHFEQRVAVRARGRGKHRDRDNLDNIRTKGKMGTTQPAAAGVEQGPRILKVVAMELVTVAHLQMCSSVNDCNSSRNPREKREKTLPLSRSTSMTLHFP